MPLVALVLSISSTAAGQVTTPDSLLAGPVPTGMDVGRLELFPSLLAEAGYDSNVYDRDVAPVADALLILRPNLVLRPDLARHELGLTITSELRRYLETENENSEQAAAQVHTKLEVRGGVDVTARGLVARRIERRGTLGDQFLTDRPIEFTELEGGLGVARNRGQLAFSAAISLNSKRFADAQVNGMAFDQSARDLRTARAAIRFDYDVSPRLRLFTRGTINSLDYRIDQSRNSGGYSILGGLAVNAGDLISAEAGIGYLSQDVDDPNLPDFDGVDYFLAATWTPTPRVEAAIAGSRDVERSPLVNIPAVVTSEFRLSGRYVVDEVTFVGLEARSTGLSYQNSDLQEDRLFLEVSATRRLGAGFSASIAGGYDRQIANIAAGREYEGAIVRLGIIWAP